MLPKVGFDPTFPAPIGGCNPIILLRHCCRNNDEITYYIQNLPQKDQNATGKHDIFQILLYNPKKFQT